MKNLFLVWVVVVFLSSCYTSRKAARQVWKAHSVYPTTLANVCNTLYTATDSIITNEIFLKGDTLILADTLIQTDTISATKYKYVYQTVHIVDTLVRNKYVQVQNMAAQELLQTKLTTLNDQLIKQNQSIKIWRIVAIVCALLIGMWLVKRILF